MTKLNGSQIKLDKLKSLYKEEPVAKAALDYFASCKKNMRETTVGRLLTVLLQRGENASYSQVRDFLRSLADLNCGEYRIGRRGWPSRLQWNVSLVSVGQAATGTTSAVEELTEEEKNAPSDEGDTVNGSVAGPEDLSLVYPLRRDREVQIVVPRDITSSEAQRLADFIKTLQFD